MSSDAHPGLSGARRDRAAAYVLGGLGPDEVTRFEAHLEQCAACREEVTRLRPVADDLVLSAPPAEPPPGLRERVLECIARERPARHAPDRDAPDARRWVPTDVPGIEIAPLWSDAEHRRHTLLVRMRPGTAIPLHRHAGPEECYVVEGDLHEGPLALGAGDHVRRDAGSEHGVSTRGGCLLLVSASQDDRRLPADPGPRHAPEAGC